MISTSRVISLLMMFVPILQILDTRDLKIHRVFDATSNADLPYSLLEPVKAFGSKLEIQLPASAAERLIF
jgi:hypothetical protein